MPKSLEGYILVELLKRGLDWMEYGIIIERAKKRFITQGMINISEVNSIINDVCGKSIFDYPTNNLTGWLYDEKLMDY